MKKNIFLTLTFLIFNLTYSMEDREASSEIETLESLAEKINTATNEFDYKHALEEYNTLIEQLRSKKEDFQLLEIQPWNTILGNLIETKLLSNISRENKREITLMLANKINSATNEIDYIQARKNLLDFIRLAKVDTQKMPIIRTWDAINKFNSQLKYTKEAKQKLTNDEKSEIMEYLTDIINTSATESEFNKALKNYNNFIKDADIAAKYPPLLSTWEDLQEEWQTKKELFQ